jgi:hypothetical protein
LAYLWHRVFDMVDDHELRRIVLKDRLRVRKNKVLYSIVTWLCEVEETCSTRWENKVHMWHFTWKSSRETLANCTSINRWWCCERVELIQESA